MVHQAVLKFKGTINGIINHSGVPPQYFTSNVSQKTQDLLTFNGNKGNYQTWKAASAFYPNQLLQGGWAKNSRQAVSS